MKGFVKIAPLVTKIAACFGVVGIALIITSPHSSQNAPNNAFEPEETSYTTYDETLPETATSSVSAYVQETEAETSEPEIQKPLHYKYTDEEIDMLAKVVYAEAGACAADEQRLVVWTVFQRVDSTDWDFRNMNDIITTVTAPNQFAYYPTSPIEEDIRNLCAEEIAKWANYEQPPTLEPYAPSLPYYFYEGDGYHNWFRAEW